MKLPFSVDEFLQVFKHYNLSVFPAQILLYVLAVVTVILSIKRTISSDRILNLILAFFWLWMGIVYHLLFFTTINKAAYLFGGLFIIEGSLFIYFGIIKKKISV